MPRRLKFIEILKNGKELIGGHYQIPLPFRNNKVNLPNNNSQEICLFGEKIFKESSIQTRLHEVHA